MKCVILYNRMMVRIYFLILLQISKFAKLLGCLSYISVNTEIEFQIHISSFGRVTALVVLIITAIPS